MKIKLKLNKTKENNNYYVTDFDAKAKWEIDTTTNTEIPFMEKIITLTNDVYHKIIQDNSEQIKKEKIQFHKIGFIKMLTTKPIGLENIENVPINTKEQNLSIAAWALWQTERLRIYPIADNNFPNQTNGFVFWKLNQLPHYPQDINHTFGPTLRFIKYAFAGFTNLKAEYVCEIPFLVLAKLAKYKDDNNKVKKETVKINEQENWDIEQNYIKSRMRDDKRKISKARYIKLTSRVKNEVNSFTNEYVFGEGFLPFFYGVHKNCIAELNKEQEKHQGKEETHAKKIN